MAATATAVLLVAAKVAVIACVIVAYRQRRSARAAHAAAAAFDDPTTGGSAVDACALLFGPDEHNGEPCPSKAPDRKVRRRRWSTGDPSSKTNA